MFQFFCLVAGLLTFSSSCHRQSSPCRSVLMRLACLGQSLTASLLSAFRRGRSECTLRPAQVGRGRAAGCAAGRTVNRGEGISGLEWEPYDRKYPVKLDKWLGCLNSYLGQNIVSITVGTPYNTAPYITGSNIARLGHGSQNLWSKLWIPVVKSAPVRVIYTWKSVPKKRIHGSSDIYLGTQWKQRHDSPWPNRLDVIVTFLWYDTIRTIGHRDHQSTTKKV